jgi:hypothetical protein
MYVDYIHPRQIHHTQQWALLMVNAERRAPGRGRHHHLYTSAQAASTANTSLS